MEKRMRQWEESLTSSYPRREMRDLFLTLTLLSFSMPSCRPFIFPLDLQFSYSQGRMAWSPFPWPAHGNPGLFHSEGMRSLWLVALNILVSLLSLRSQGLHCQETLMPKETKGDLLPNLTQTQQGWGSHELHHQIWSHLFQLHIRVNIISSNNNRD